LKELKIKNLELKIMRAVCQTEHPEDSGEVPQSIGHKNGTQSLSFRGTRNLRK
jgi:hypothetical protein